MSVLREISKFKLKACIHPSDRQETETWWCIVYMGGYGPWSVTVHSWIALTQHKKYVRHTWRREDMQGRRVDACVHDHGHDARSTGGEMPLHRKRRWLTSERPRAKLAWRRPALRHALDMNSNACRSNLGGVSSILLGDENRGVSLEQ